MEKVKLLGVVGSPRKKGNTRVLVDKALEGAMTLPNVETEVYELAGKKIHHCIGCFKCIEKGGCIFKDDLQKFAEKYMEVDGILWGAPVYHISIPASMKALLDRMGNMLAVHYATQLKDLPRFSKVCGVLTGGMDHYGGQDLVLSFMVNSCLLLNNVVVSGDTMTGNYMGAAACTGITDNPMGIPDPFDKKNVLKDEKGMKAAESLGKRVAEMTTIVKTGMSTLKTDLPDEYFQKWQAPPEKPADKEAAESP